MRICHHTLIVLGLVACCCGCNENPFRNIGSADEATRADVQVTSSNDVDSVGEPASDERTASDRVRQRVGELFERVLPTLDQARELVDQHASLPDNSMVPFKADKQSNSADLNELLDEAIEMLGISEVSDYRQRIRNANDAIATSHANIADYRRQRVSASWAKDQTQLDKVNPFELSKEALDEAIAAEKVEIESQRAVLVELKKSFAEELSKIGVEVDADGVDTLLSSVSGDDIVTMAVVFDNIKQLTTQFQELTEESGEALDVAKRYYGMYVVMIHVMDRIQKTFVRNINEKHIPKLREFEAQADVNIDQARALIEMNAGDRKLLEANIESNRLTKRTASMYVDYLKRNATQIATENKRAQKNLVTAMNTYDTVKLSSDVATLMNTGRREFETLMKLQVPTLREFSNESVRKEFERMTLELRTGG